MRPSERWEQGGATPDIPASALVPPPGGPASLRRPRSLTRGQRIFLLLAIPLGQMQVLAAVDRDPFGFAQYLMLVTWCLMATLFFGYFAIRGELTWMAIRAESAPPELVRRPHRLFWSLFAPALQIALLPWFLCFAHATVRFAMAGAPGLGEWNNWPLLVALPGPLLLFLFMSFRAVDILPPTKSDFVVGLLAAKGMILFAGVFLLPTIRLMDAGSPDREWTRRDGRPATPPGELFDGPIMEGVFWFFIAMSWLLPAAAYREAVQRITPQGEGGTPDAE